MVQIDIQKKVGRMFVVGFPGRTITEEMKHLIHTYHIGGVILFSRNLGTAEEVRQLTYNLQKEAQLAGYKRPLLICVDQEHGIVRRLTEGVTLFPGAMALGATRDPEAAYDISYATGKELQALGINWNLAPDVDINNNSDNPVIGVRSFGESPEKVTEFGLVSMKGLQSAKVIPTLKHFPGHGDTNVDSHLALPVLTHELERLKEVEFKPFVACIEEGADVIMTAHLYFSNIADQKGTPATLSKRIITNLLRETLNYQGVVTTDCMEMDAIAENIGTEQGAVKAIQAGVDIVMVSHTFEKQIGAIQAVISAIDQGLIFEKSIEQSNERVNSLIDRYLSWNDSMNLDQYAHIDFKKHQELAEKTYEKSVTIIKNEGVLPIKNDGETKVLVLNPTQHVLTKAEDVREKQTLGDAVKIYHPEAAVKEMTDSFSDEELASFVQYASTFEEVIFGTIQTQQDSPLVQLVEKLKEKGVNLIGVGMRSPYDVKLFPDADAFINTYEPTFTALNIAAGTIFGKRQATGSLPVTLDN